MKALGAPLRHFGYNRGWAVFFTFGTLMFATIGVASITVLRDQGMSGAAIIFFGMAALCAFSFIHTVSSSVDICETGLRYKLLRKKGEMSWDDIEKFRYSLVVTYHQLFIKTTRYSLTLFDKSGEKITLGSSFERPKELAALLVQALQPRLFQKLLAAFDSGQDIDLGEVKISRERIEMKIGLFKKKIPIANVAGCSIEKGLLKIGERVNGKVKQRSVFLRSVDNGFALADLINGRIVPRSMGASAGV